MFITDLTVMNILFYAHYAALFFIILNSRLKLVINIHTIFSESRQAIYAVEMTIPSNECLLN